MALPLALGLLGLGFGGSYLGGKINDWQSADDAAKLKELAGHKYQMDENEMFPGEQPIPGLKGKGLLGGEITPEQFYTGLLDIPSYQAFGLQKLAELKDPNNIKSPYESIAMDAQGQPWGMNRKTGQFERIATSGGMPAQKPYTDIGQLEADYRAGIIDQQQRDYWLTLLGARATGKSPDPYFSPIYDAERGLGTFDHRTGRTAFNNPIPIVKPGDSPKLQGQIAGARTTGEAGAKRDFNMMGVGDIIEQADTILATGKPTQSLLGSGLDVAAGVVGLSPEGAAETDQLKVLSGFLVSKMPRMEGPQSDVDVQNYKAMAADIGNPTIPISRRRAALQMLKGIIAKYDNGGQTPQQQAHDAAPNAAPAQAPTVRRYNPQTKRFE